MLYNIWYIQCRCEETYILYSSCTYNTNAIHAHNKNIIYAHVHNHAHTMVKQNTCICRQKWVMHLSWQEQGGHEQWTVSDDLRLIRNLTNQDAGDEEEVEWEEMCDRWGSARGPYYLRNKWTALKRDVPNYRIKTFQGCSSPIQSSMVVHPRYNLPRLFIPDTIFHGCSSPI